MSIAEKLTTIAENQQKVYEAGKAKAIYDWWDMYQKQYHGTEYETNRKSYLYAFAGHCWNDSNYNPIRTITATAHCGNMYSYSDITDTKVAIDISGTNTTNMTGAFANATKLVTIRKLIVSEVRSMSAQFTNCNNLQNLVIEGTIAKDANFQWCPLTRESIESVVAALSDTANGVTVTFKTSAVNNAFSTDEWDAVVASKPNWTFTLVD